MRKFGSSDGLGQIRWIRADQMD